MSRNEIRIVGIGGQGVVLSGVILGRAACLYDDQQAIQTQVYGSDIRGGDVCCEVVVSDEDIVYPAVKKPNILVVLAQRAFDGNIDDLQEDGILIVDSDLVDTGKVQEKVETVGAPFNRIAIDEMGSRIVSNMIMLGYFTEKTRVVSLDSLKKAVSDLVPARTVEMNLGAVEKGVSLAQGQG